MRSELGEDMLIVRNHSFVVTPRMWQALAIYTKYFRDDLECKLREYEAEFDGRETGARDASLVASVQKEIQRAEVIAQDVERLRDELQHIYRWHFERLAEVFRRTRLDLQAERIEDIPHVMMALRYAMQMLSEENPKFNSRIFIEYINGGENDNPERQQHHSVRRTQRRIYPTVVAERAR